MRKRWFRFLLPMTIVLIGGLIGLNLYFDQSILLKNFPLQQKWVANLPEEVNGLSTNGAQIIFARTHSKLIGLDASSGKILWSHKLAAQASAEPAVAANGKVYIADSQWIWALDEFTGEVLWQQPAPDVLAEVRSASASFVALDISQDVYILKAANGSLAWNKAVCRNERRYNRNCVDSKKGDMVS